jgi:hypothetical protein
MTSLEDLNNSFPTQTDLTRNNTFTPGDWIVRCPSENGVNNFLVAMVNMLKAAKPVNNQIYIDFTDLWGWTDPFFTTKVKIGADQPQSISDALKALLDQNPNANVTIRYLDGKQDPIKPLQAPNDVSTMIKNAAGSRQNVNAYYGYLGITVGKALGDKESVQKSMDDIKNSFSLVNLVDEAVGGGAKDFIDKIFEAVQGICAGLLAHWDKIVSWNHCKIFAINGQSVLQGGANFWGPDYVTSGPHDLLTSLDGNSAVSAHNWCNKMWSAVTSDNTQLIFGSSKTVPPFALAPPTPAGTDKVLSIGDGAFMNENGATIFTALVDAVFNVAYYFVQKNPSYTQAFSLIMHAFSLFGTGQLSVPRQVRYKVLSSAQNTVCIHQQKLVMDDLWQSGGAVDAIRKYLPGWDGNVWDFALMSQLAQLSSTGKQVKILVSYQINGSHAGYQDPVSQQQFMDVITMLNGTPANITYRRIKGGSVASQGDSNHAKSFLVDDKILNIGSHNFYLGYNQEFEIYTDSATAIREWKPYFDQLFNA